VHFSVRELLPSPYVCAGDAANKKGIDSSMPEQNGPDRLPDTITIIFSFSRIIGGLHRVTLLKRPSLLVLEEKRPNVVLVSLLNSAEEVDAGFFIDLLMVRRLG
jgi:hypothetical protein